MNASRLCGVPVDVSLLVELKMKLFVLRSMLAVLGFRVWGFKGSGFGGLGFRIWGFRVQDLGV